MYDGGQVTPTPSWSACQPPVLDRQYISTANSILVHFEKGELATNSGFSFSYKRVQSQSGK